MTTEKKSKEKKDPVVKTEDFITKKEMIEMLADFEILMYNDLISIINNSRDQLFKLGTNHCLTMMDLLKINVGQKYKQLMDEKK